MRRGRIEDVPHLLTPCELAIQHVMADGTFGCVIGSGALIRQDFGSGMAHPGHAGAKVSVFSAGNGAKNGCPQKNGVRLFGQENATACCVSMLTQEDVILGATPRGEDRVDPVALGIERINDVFGAVCETLQRSEIQLRQIIRIG